MQHPATLIVQYNPPRKSRYGPRLRTCVVDALGHQHHQGCKICAGQQVVLLCFDGVKARPGHESSSQDMQASKKRPHSGCCHSAVTSATDAGSTR